MSRGVGKDLVVGSALRGEGKRGGANTVWCVGMRIRTGSGRGASSVPQISTSFGEISLSCPYNHRAPNSSAEIVRALVALRALLSHFLPVFSRPPLPPPPLPPFELQAKLPHRPRIIVVRREPHNRADSMTNTAPRAGIREK